MRTYANHNSQQIFSFFSQIFQPWGTELLTSSRFLDVRRISPRHWLERRFVFILVFFFHLINTCRIFSLVLVGSFLESVGLLNSSKIALNEKLIWQCTVWCKREIWRDNRKGSSRDEELVNQRRKWNKIKWTRVTLFSIRFNLKNIFYSISLLPEYFKTKGNYLEQLIFLFSVRSSKKKEGKLASQNDVENKMIVWCFVIGCPLPRLQRFPSPFSFWPISKCNHYHQVTPGVCLQPSTWHSGAVYPSSRGKRARQNAVSLFSPEIRDVA